MVTGASPLSPPDHGLYPRVRTFTRQIGVWSIGRAFKSESLVRDNPIQKITAENIDTNVP